MVKGDLKLIEAGILLIDYTEKGRAGKYSVPYTIDRVGGRLQLTISGVFNRGKRIPQPYSENVCEQIRLEADCDRRGIEKIVYLTK